VDQDEGKIFIHQRSYIEKMLRLYGMEDCNVRSPMDINMKMEECIDNDRADILVY